MKEYMVEFSITGNPNSKEFQDLIPAEKAKVGELLLEKVLKGIWLKEDYSGGYFIAGVKDETALDELLKSLPLYPYLGFKSYQLKV